MVAVVQGGVSVRGVFVQGGGLCPGRVVSVQGGWYLFREGGLCPGKGVSVEERGSLSMEGWYLSMEGWYLFREVGLRPGKGVSVQGRGPLPREGVSVQGRVYLSRGGSLSKGVSVQGCNIEHQSWLQWRTPGVQILSILCSFGTIWQNRMLAPLFGGLARPPRRNTGSATGLGNSSE